MHIWMPVVCNCVMYDMHPWCWHIEYNMTWFHIIWLYVWCDRLQTVLVCLSHVLVHTYTYMPCPTYCRITSPCINIIRSSSFISSHQHYAAAADLSTRNMNTGYNCYGTWSIHHHQHHRQQHQQRTTTASTTFLTSSTSSNNSSHGIAESKSNGGDVATSPTEYAPLFG